MHRATAELKASGIEAHALKVGDRAPSFALFNRTTCRFLRRSSPPRTAEEFRLVFTLPDYLRDLYKSFGNALDRFRDEPEYRLPIPARYVVDKEGIIRGADVNADYTIRLEPAETLKELRNLTV
jgi:hypothetical protein